MPTPTRRLLRHRPPSGQKPRPLTPPSRSLDRRAGWRADVRFAGGAAAPATSGSGPRGRQHQAAAKGQGPCRRRIHRSPQSARVQGIVIVEATIGVDGRVQDARVLRSIPLLDAAAVEAVKQWEYTPTLLNGVPVPVIMTVTVNLPCGESCTVSCAR